MTSAVFQSAGTEGSEIRSQLNRSALEGRTVQVLQRGNWASPDVSLMELRCGRQIIVKDFAPRTRLVKASYGRWVTGREVKAYRRLEGLSAVPDFLGCIDSFALALEYRPGDHMSRSLAGTLSNGFMDELRSAVRGMHERGVVHLDLRHRSNVLADAEGHPVVIDFGSALCLRPRGLLFRLLMPVLAWIDRSAVRKWEVRVAPRD
jgi:serine/threonine protein kinase